ncbi:hypothetical protein TTHERM_00655950 (macronuclear) [Tetrahymena thermophila SB210]|uniref:Uncharacterized protein n=1 Tax=Tetrahymena thermophila (strain SB210) TaxID=312017 RepID=Q22GW1_TETTS|nr:hypothetical protein TTHERM_00655950 [Tetrahymena thermophila SB210]EAR84563.1 hypothetical protein TTHERM_00655950 [Tetrahymena thermophila SB210]|eukprot:XP_001032226.1 hypothetical protein TTHERM_00655950 [Tetrahymena thermophila SB210]
MNYKSNPYELNSSQSQSEVLVFGQNQVSSTKKVLHDMQNEKNWNYSNRGFAPSANLLKSTKNEQDKDKKMKQTNQFHQNQKNILNNGVLLFKKQMDEVSQQQQQQTQNRGRNLLNQKQNLPYFSKKFLSQSIDQEASQINSALGSQIRRIYQKNRCISQLSQYEFDTNNRFVLGSSIDRNNQKQLQIQQQQLKNELFVSNRAFNPQSTSSHYNKSQSPKFQQAYRTSKGLSLYQNEEMQGEENNFFGDISVEIPSKYQQLTSKSNINNANNTKYRFLVQQNQTPSQNKQLTKLTEQDSSQFTLVSIEQFQNSNQKVIQDTSNPLKFHASNPFVQKNSKNSKRYDANININEGLTVKSSHSQHAKSKSPNSFLHLQKDQSFSQSKNQKQDQAFTKMYENSQNNLIKSEIPIDDGLHSLKNHLHNTQLKNINNDLYLHKSKQNSQIHGSIEIIDLKQITNQKEISNIISKQQLNKQNTISLYNSSNKALRSNQQENNQAEQSTIIYSTENPQRQKNDQSLSEKKYQTLVCKMKECFEKFQTNYRQINKQADKKALNKKEISSQNLQNCNEITSLSEYLENQDMKHLGLQDSKDKKKPINKKLCNIGLNMIHRLFIKKYGQNLLTQMKIQKQIDNYSTKHVKNGF